MKISDKRYGEYIMQGELHNLRSSSRYRGVKSSPGLEFIFHNTFKFYLGKSLPQLRHLCILVFVPRYVALKENRRRSYMIMESMQITFSYT